MQKLTMILVALLTMSLSVYSQSTNSKGNTKMEKTLVAYFSASGTTEKVAKSLAKSCRGRASRDQTSSEIFRCRPKLA